MILTGRRVAVYARFSSDRQSETSIEDQIARCRRWVEERGGTVDAGLVFADFAISAASMDRPGWSALEARITARGVDVVVVESLDRVSRKVGDTARLLERFRFAGVQLLGVADATDTAAPSALMHTTMRGLMAESYLADLADKTRRGLEGRARAGGPTGGLPYGYRSADAPGGRVIEIDPDQAAVVRRIFDAYAGAASFSAIAGGLNRDGVPAPRSSRRDRATPATWAATTIRSLVSNATYAGRWVWNRRVWVKVPGTNRRIPRERPRAEWIETVRPELAIVDDRTWARANARTEGAAAAAGTLSTSERRGASRRSYLLSGLLRCGACGALMTITGGVEGRRYYRCGAAHARESCNERGTFLERDAREAFVGALRSTLFDPAVLEEVIAIVTEEIERDAGGAVAVEAARAKVARLETQVARLVDALVGGASSALADRLRMLEADLASARGELGAAMASRAAIDPTAVLAEVRGLGVLLEGEDIPGAREALRRALGPDGITATAEGGAFVLRAHALPASLVGGRGRLREIRPIAGARFVGLLTEATVRRAG